MLIGPEMEPQCPAPSVPGWRQELWAHTGSFSCKHVFIISPFVEHQNIQVWYLKILACHIVDIRTEEKDNPTYKESSELYAVSLGVPICENTICVLPYFSSQKYSNVGDMNLPPFAKGKWKL